MLMLLEAWEGINLSRNVAFSKQKMIIETIPTIQGQDSHFRFAKRSWNQTTVQTFSGWLQHHKKTQKRIKFPVPVIHVIHYYCFIFCFRISFSMLGNEATNFLKRTLPIRS